MKKQSKQSKPRAVVAGDIDATLIDFRGKGFKAARAVVVARIKQRVSQVVTVPMFNTRTDEKGSVNLVMVTREFLTVNGFTDADSFVDRGIDTILTALDNEKYNGDMQWHVTLVHVYDDPDTHTRMPQAMPDDEGQALLHRVMREAGLADPLIAVLKQSFAAHQQQASKLASQDNQFQGFLNTALKPVDLA
jgi:hypothetical protein